MTKKFKLPNVFFCRAGLGAHCTYTSSAKKPCLAIYFFSGMLLSFCANSLKSIPHLFLLLPMFLALLSVFNIFFNPNNPKHGLIFSKLVVKPSNEDQTSSGNIYMC